MQRLCGNRRHARFQSRQIDPAGDLTGIRLNDCDSILQQNVGVDLAVDELQLIQIFDRLVAVEHFEAAQLGESLGTQKSQFRGAVAHDEAVIVMSEAPSFTSVHETRPWVERRNVVGQADVVSQVATGVLEKCTPPSVPYPRTPPPSWSQLDQPALPLRQAFAEVAAIHGALLNDFAGLQPNLSQ